MKIYYGFSCFFIKVVFFFKFCVTPKGFGLWLLGKLVIQNAVLYPFSQQCSHFLRFLFIIFSSNSRVQHKCTFLLSAIFMPCDEGSL